MNILAIETSCDETAVAIINIQDEKIRVLANIVSSQIKLHSKFGGVVPQLAARAHLQNMVPTLQEAFRQSRIDKNEVDYIAFTKGPGLAPALMIGGNTAKALAFSWEKPLIEVNHLEGHIYVNWLEGSGLICNLKDISFPVLALIISGGHTQLVLMKNNMQFEIVGETLDDAAGEAFDKVAKILDLEYPGGPIIENLALEHKKKGSIKFPRPMLNSKDFNFSFSGLKTAVLYEVRKYGNLTVSDKANIAASFQQAVIDVLVAKTIKASQFYKVKNIVLGGGVSANQALRQQLETSLNKSLPMVRLLYPPKALATDNALMIAVAGYFHILQKQNIISWQEVSTDSNLRLK